MTSLETLSEVASVVTGGAALGGLALAVWQVNRTHTMTREATATDLFNQSLLMSLEYPDLAFPSTLNKMSSLDMSRYESFMSAVLLSSEEILSVTRNNDEWRNSIKENLICHTEYLSSRYNDEYPMNKFYGEELVGLVDEIVAEHRNAHHA